MARFCMKCGSPLEETVRFCSKCGAEAVTPGTPAPAAPASAVAAATPSPRVAAAPVAAAPPAQSGAPLLKIILIVLGIFAFVTVVGIGSCFYVSYRVKKKFDQTIRVDESGKSVTITTPKGELKLGERTGKAATSDIGGVPPYPGSTPLEGGGQLTLPGAGEVAGQDYETPDPVEKVVGFYKDKFGSKLSIVGQQDHQQLTLVDPEKGATTIEVAREEGASKTKITIVHMGK